ncbi:MAG: hypothetical protein KJ666_14330 [Bacteroidetes bacterium]|nr:hypothetical protein [Bacteroidota bacterium]
MTEKAFFNSVLNDNGDILSKFIALLKKLNVDYCIIDSLAVNAYVEPVVSLDLDIVLAVDSLEKFINQVKEIFKVEEFTHSYNLSSKDSYLRIQIQKDERYQSFINKAIVKKVLGYELKVAAIEDVLLGKVWAYSDTERRQSKRQCECTCASLLLCAGIPWEKTLQIF